MRLVHTIFVFEKAEEMLRTLIVNVARTASASAEVTAAFTPFTARCLASTGTSTDAEVQRQGVRRKAVRLACSADVPINRLILMCR